MKGGPMSNEELQKAIDDITKENGRGSSAQASAPVNAGVPAGAVPAGMMPGDDSPAAAMPASDAAMASDMVAPIAPPPVMPNFADAPVAPVVSRTRRGGTSVALGADGLIDANMAARSSRMAGAVSAAASTADLVRVRQDALRELFPLMDKLNIDPVQKFGLYKDIIDLTKEHSAVEAAHETILQIADEQIRADALLELIEIISAFKV